MDQEEYKEVGDFNPNDRSILDGYNDDSEDDKKE